METTKILLIFLVGIGLGVLFHYIWAVLEKSANRISEASKINPTIAGDLFERNMKEFQLSHLQFENNFLNKKAQQLKSENELLIQKLNTKLTYNEMSAEIGKILILNEKVKAENELLRNKEADQHPKIQKYALIQKENIIQHFEADSFEIDKEGKLTGLFYLKGKLVASIGKNHSVIKVD